MRRSIRIGFGFGLTSGIIITTPQDVALVSVRKSINFIKNINMPVIGIIENMSSFKCPHCGKDIKIFKTGGGLKTSKNFLVSFLGRIPIDPEIAKTGNSGEPFVVKNNDSDSAKAVEEIVDNIENTINKRG